MSEGFYFYCNDKFIKHFAIAADSFRKVEPNANATLIGVGKSDKKLKAAAEKYSFDFALFNPKDLVTGLVDSVKAFAFDLVDYNKIIQYDCDFIFHKELSPLFELADEKISMVIGHSRGKQIDQEKYHKIYSALGKYDISVEDSIVYNAGFYIASRQHHTEVFEEWKKLILKSPNVASKDQYALNYLVQTRDLLRELPKKYNYHSHLPHSDEVVATHYAGHPWHKEHLKTGKSLGLGQ